jgi:hypothetical protein
MSARNSDYHTKKNPCMTRTIEFVYYLFWVGVLIGALHLADVRPWAEWMAMIAWPILIGVSVWFIGSYLPTRRRW